MSRGGLLRASVLSPPPLNPRYGPSLDRYRACSIAISHSLPFLPMLSPSFSHLMLEYRSLQFLLHGNDLLLQALGYFHSSWQVVSTQCLVLGDNPDGDNPDARRVRLAPTSDDGGESATPFPPSRHVTSRPVSSPFVRPSAPKSGRFLCRAISRSVANAPQTRASLSSPFLPSLSASLSVVGLFYRSLFLSPELGATHALTLRTHDLAYDLPPSHFSGQVRR